MLYYTVVTLYVVACFLLLLIVLLQQGRGGDIASAFGGSGSQTAFGARQGATVLTKASTILGALFMIGALALAIIGTRGPSSVVGGTSAPQPARSAPATPTAPANPSSSTTPAPQGQPQGGAQTLPAPAQPPGK